ncbi:MAG: thiamine pyrophosphate-dependent dehydrogenase E1 component subunit alpha [Gemmatimonadota bacterium]
MKRYPAFDPPEYVDWSPRPELVEEYEARLREDSRRREVVESLGPERLLDLYRGLLRFRLHDIALKRWVKQGVISKAWLGTGEEAVTVGAVHALRRGAQGDVVGPMIRNAGACHEMGMSIADMLRAYLATGDSPTRGRDLHIGDLRCGVVAPISMVGALATVMNGFALAFKYGRQARVALTWMGDGATKHGESHEALNFAAVMRLPIVFVLQNNQVALGTRFDQHHRAADFGEWGKAYGVPLLPVDGNNVLDVHAAAVLAVRKCRAGEGPIFLAAETFRMGGHATHDEQEARQTFAPELFARWGRRDPIGLYEEYLVRRPFELGEEAGASREERNRACVASVESEVIAEVERAAEDALESRRRRMPDPETDAEAGVYA